MTDHVTLFEVGPRDGLQNEPTSISTGQKVQLVNALADVGLLKIEVGSFVSPKRVPQMADSADVFAGIIRKPRVVYSALVPNLQGCEAAIASGVDEVAIFASASETFSQKNINCSIAESLDRFRPVIRMASDNDIPVRGYVSCVTDCPYEGPISPIAVSRASEALIAMGCYEISLGDTIGKGRPETVSAMLDRVMQTVSADQIAGHFHDTDGYALRNIEACLMRGIRVFDTSIAGLGGCPYAPGAAGNVATETVAQWLDAQGFHTGLDLAPLTALARDTERCFKSWNRLVSDH